MWKEKGQLKGQLLEFGGFESVIEQQHVYHLSLWTNADFIV